MLDNTTHIGRKDSKSLFNISTCEIAKEIWDKLEVSCEGTTKVKEARISDLVNEYELIKKEEMKAWNQCSHDSAKLYVN